MHLKAGKAVHDVLDRVLGSAVQRQAGEADPQRLGRNAGERVAGVNIGEGEAVGARGVVQTAETMVNVLVQHVLHRSLSPPTRERGRS